MEDVHRCVKVVNKEVRRKNGSLFQGILLKKANSKLIYEMIKNDPSRKKAQYVAKKTHAHSNARRVADYVNSI